MVDKKFVKFAPKVKEVNR